MEQQRPREKLIALTHSALGRRSGIWGKYQRAKTYFFWPKMKKDMHEFVTSFDMFQRNIGENNHHVGLLQPLPLPKWTWRNISLDCVEGLPKSESVRCHRVGGG